MPRFEELRPHLQPILQERPDHYWLSYQILLRLREREPNLLAELEARYPGQGYGKGGGAPFRPDNAISLCLAGWLECVDTRYLNGSEIFVRNIESSAEQLGIFRWKEPS